MKIEQIYTGCLAQGAYYIESNGEAAIIDPLRETKPYIAKAEKDGAKIKYIFETHFHADFVSGHVSLADKTGASIVFGPNADTKYDSIGAEDGQEFRIGEVVIKALHTPGHTLESTTYLLIDHLGKEQAIFSGDTLFIGDVGRPDLAVKSNLSQQDLAELLYHSLRDKIMPLPDDVLVYPAHGAGSACGKNTTNTRKRVHVWILGGMIAMSSLYSSLSTFFFSANSKNFSFSSPSNSKFALKFSILGNSLLNFFLFLSKYVKIKSL